MSAGGGASSGEVKACYGWLRGKCRWGDECKFEHPKGKQGSDKAAGGDAATRKSKTKESKAAAAKKTETAPGTSTIGSVLDGVIGSVFKNADGQSMRAANFREGASFAVVKVADASKAFSKIMSNGAALPDGANDPSGLVFGTIVLPLAVDQADGWMVGDTDTKVTNVSMIPDGTQLVGYTVATDHVCFVHAAYGAPNANMHVMGTHAKINLIDVSKLRRVKNALALVASPLPRGPNAVPAKIVFGFKDIDIVGTAQALAGGKLRSVRLWATMMSRGANSLNFGTISTGASRYTGSKYTAGTMMFIVCWTAFMLSRDVPEAAIAGPMSGDMNATSLHLE